ncbi:MAG: hypothetical protein CMJ85_12890 [Planctomycetes bacterium]|jgi:hypothetical protein|nr:hypothetical protein [Planctomycetota bacterium]
MNQDLSRARKRAYELMRDGREDVFLAEFDANPAWAKDASLLRLHGDALWAADRLNEAEASYRRVLTLPGVDGEKRLARRSLDGLEEEWRVIGRSRAALWRARWAIAGTMLVAVGVTWLLVRRQGMR